MKNVYDPISVRYYDRIYAAVGKDYGKESGYVISTLRAHGLSGRVSLLDVACGTGSHLSTLQDHCDVEGVDISDDFLAAARARLPEVRFHKGDMRTFRTGRTYDVVICMFSSIGYMATEQDLRTAILNMALHLDPGGLLLVEPWFAPGVLEPDRISMVVVEEPGLKLVRMNTLQLEETISAFDFHYLIGTPSGVEHRIESHRLGLFGETQFREASTSAAMSVEYDAEGPTGRGLYVGRHR